MATLKDPITGRHTMGMRATNDNTVNSKLRVGGIAGTAVAESTRNVVRSSVAVPAGALTLTAAQVRGGMIVLTGANGAQNLVVPNPSLFEAEGDYFTGDLTECEVINRNNGIMTLTVSADGLGTVATLGALTIPVNTASTLKIRFNATGYEAWLVGMT